MTEMNLSGEQFENTQEAEIVEGTQDSPETLTEEVTEQAQAEDTEAHI